MPGTDGDAAVQSRPVMPAFAMDLQPASSSSVVPYSSNSGRLRTQNVPHRLHSTTDPLTPLNFIDTRSRHHSVSGSARSDSLIFPFSPRPHSWIGEVRGCWDELALEGDDVGDVLEDAMKRLVVKAEWDR